MSILNEYYIHIKQKRRKESVVLHEASQSACFTNALFYEALALRSDIYKAEDLAYPEFTRAIYHFHGTWSL